MPKLDYNPTIFISGRHPSKKNSQRILRKKIKGRSVPFIASSLAFEKWEPLAILEAKIKWNLPRIKKCKSISYFFIYADNRVKDGGNSAEGIQDIFQKEGVDILVGDNWQITGKTSQDGRLAKKGEECGCFITFEVEEYE
jgi:hypothetical protein|tara:strand:+ start:84 stop:503 length:420 start_codon:yes stop_codon:yes gene_type:complete